MAPASNDEQFKFLISCIRYSNNGKVDFVEVARECNIVSKGAAAKRYERMMKAHGIHQSAASIRDAPIPSRRRDKEAKCGDAKKRKFDQFANDNNSIAGDDDESIGKVKDEPVKRGVKKETEVKLENSLSDSFFPYPTIGGNQRMSIDGNSMFQDFLHSAAFEQDASQSHADFDNDVNQSGQDSVGRFAANGSGNDLRESIIIAD